MRIIEVPKRFTKFDELKPGDVFNYDGNWYMKIDIINMPAFNTVNLETGTLGYIVPYSKVDYQDAELRVEEF